MKVEKTPIEDLYVVVPSVFEDERGFFMEVYRKDKFKEFGIDSEFVQDNHSRSVKNVLRGLHFQWSPPMGKLMRVTQGKAFLFYPIPPKYNIGAQVYTTARRSPGFYGTTRILG